MTDNVSRPSDVVNRAYAILSGDDDLDRACEAIPEVACTAVPRNFLLNLANGAATKLAEQIASPGLVLAWLLGAIGAPLVLAGFLVPIRQAGALMPQLAAAARIRAVPLRKLYWARAGTVQAFALAAMIPAVIVLPPTMAGFAVLGLLTVFSVASGVGSVAFQDVMGKTVPKARRGRLLAGRAAVGGALAVGVALFLHLGPDFSDRLWPILVLVGAAALLWLVGAGLFAAIDEVPGETGGGRNPLAEARRGLSLVRA
ncbi:MAG: MFS transporter, partial [Rhodospirillaceae bacterium]|nr:MFS transporter [Rhodospirillaceae bacterium]